MKQMIEKSDFIFAILRKMLTFAGVLYAYREEKGLVF